MLGTGLLVLNDERVVELDSDTWSKGLDEGYFIFARVGGVLELCALPPHHMIFLETVLTRVYIRQQIRHSVNCMLTVTM